MSRIAEQRRRAAALGTEVRSRRAAVKKQIAAGEISLVDLLVPTRSTSVAPWPVASAAIAEEIATGQLLRSVPGIGPKNAGEIIADLQLNPNQPLGELSREKRRDLADEIERT